MISASHKLEDLRSVLCYQQVRKQLPHCEHSAVMPCHQDPETFHCTEPCRGVLSCCSRTCKAVCSECQKVTIERTESTVPTGKITRTSHRTHPCERMLYCQHKCGLACSQDHECNTACSEKCRQQCSHNRCTQPCHVACAPCMEPCMWQCEHAACPVLCGSVWSVSSFKGGISRLRSWQICSRLPCDEPCKKILECGHPCPSG